MATATNQVISVEKAASLFPVVAARGLLKALLLLAVLLASVTPLGAQTTAISGTFKTPGGQTPAAGNLKPVTTINGTPVYGTAEFDPYDMNGNHSRRIVCGGITFLPQSVRGWIRGDGVLVNANASVTSVSLVPTKNCQPANPVYRAVHSLNGSVDGPISALSWTEFKGIPQMTLVDWAQLSIVSAGQNRTAFSYVQQNGGTIFDYLDFNNDSGAIPANPPGYCRAYFDATLAKLRGVTSTGADCNPGGAGSLASLNGLTGPSQTFAKADDANVTLGIASTGSSHTCTLGWTGALAKSRQNSATAYVDQANTFSAGAQDFDGVSSFVIRKAAGAGPTASGGFAYDTTLNLYKVGVNGVAKTLATTDASITGNAAKATALASAPSACSGNNFALGIAVSGNASCAEPGFSNLSGIATVGQIPSLPASQIGGGQMALARGGTNADLSAMGGTSQVLKQVIAGGPVTVGQLVAADITGVQSPSGNDPDLQVKSGAGFASIATPTTPNGVPQTLVSAPSGGAQQATFQMNGLVSRTISASTDTVVAAGRSPKLLNFTNTSGTTMTVPDVGSAGFTGNPHFYALTNSGLLGFGDVNVTFNRTSMSTFTVCVGGYCSPGRTTFNPGTAQRAHFSSPDGANWLVEIDRREVLNIYHQYVSLYGNDANDGYTWQSAKKTVYAALLTLPGAGALQSGYGTVFVGDGAFANPTAGAGIWLMGPNDPNYASPPAGWLRAPAGGQGLHIIGVGCHSFLGNATSPACAVSNITNATAGLWISSTNNAMKFENLKFDNPAIVVRIGVKSDGTRNTTSGGVQNVQFINVQGSVNGGNLNSGPTVDIGSDNYFIHFEKSAFQGNLGQYQAAILTVSQSGFTETVNTTAPNNFVTGMKCGLVQIPDTRLNFSAGSQTLGGITVVNSTQFTFARPENQSVSSSGGYVVCDKGLNIVIDPGTGLGSGLLWFRDTQLNGGGIRLWSGPSNTVMYVDGVTLEGPFGTQQTGPGVWVGTIGSNGLVSVKNVFLADTQGNPIYNVINDNFVPGGHVLYEGCATPNCASGNPLGSGVHLIEPNYFFNAFGANDCLKVLDVAANIADAGAPCFQQGKLPQAYDNFNRANGSPGANWTQIVFGGNAGTPTIASNQFSVTSAVTTTTVYEQAYTANRNPPNSTIGSNQWCEVTVTALTTGTTGRVGCGVRRTATTAFGTGYVCYENDVTAAIGRMSASQTDIATISVTGVAGDVIRCEASGSTITMYRNGASILNVTDSNFPTGQPSLYLLTSAVIGLTESGDNWSAGSLPGAFATLDAEQSFSQPQHFHSMTIGPASPSRVPGALANDTLYVPNIVLNGSNPLNGVSGNSGKVAQSSGTMTQTKLKTADANGNIVDAAGSGTLGITFPLKIFIRFAICNNGVAALSTDTTAASTVACFGTNTKLGVWQAQDADVLTFSYLLTTDFTGAIDGRLAFNSPDTTGTAIFNIALACVDGSGATADDPAYNTPSAFNTITLASPANASWIASVSNIAQSGTTCAAGNWLNGKITRATDTGASRVNVKGLELTVRRAL